MLPRPFLGRSPGVVVGSIISAPSRGSRGQRRPFKGVSAHGEEVLLNLSTLCFFLTIHSVAPYLSQYAVELGASEAMVALLGPFFAASAMAFRPVSGVLADRGWTKRLLLIGSLASAIAQLIYLASPSMELLYAGRFVQGAAVAIFIPASFQAAAIGDRERVISSLAWRNTVTGVSFALGPAIGGYISQHLGYRALFTFSTAMGLTAAALIAPIGSSRFSYRGRAGEGQAAGGGLWLADRGFLTALASLLLYSSSYMCLTLFLPAYHKQAGAGASIVAIYFTLMAGANLLSRVAFRYVVRVASPEATAALGISMVSAGYIAVSLDPLSPQIIYYGLVAGAGSGLAVPSLQVIAITGIPQGRRGLASAIYTAMFDLGNLVGPLAASTLATTYHGMISVGAYLTLASLAPIAMLTATNMHSRGGAGIAKTGGEGDHDKAL